MRVGTADGKRGDGSGAGVLGVRPDCGFGEQPHGPGRPIHMRAGLIHVQGGRQYVVVESQDHFDQPGSPGGGLGMTEVGFDRSQPQRMLGITRSPVGGDQRPGFDRIAQTGAGPVRLDHIDLAQADSGMRRGLLNDALLCRAVGGGQPVGGPVLIDRRSRDHRQHRMVVVAGIAETLEDDHRGAFAPAGPVSSRGERFAPPVGGQSPLPSELGEYCRCGHDGDATGQRQTAFAVAQRLACQMGGHQR
ncbi:hypothetical protein MSIMFI_05381 [Mycobacterium simulans]|nr:hypothetical protein MSIMFI_05381 [Mycobacterium simulans]